MKSAIFTIVFSILFISFNAFATDQVQKKTKKIKVIQDDTANLVDYDPDVCENFGLLANELEMAFRVFDDAHFYKGITFNNDRWRRKYEEALESMRSAVSLIAVLENQVDPDMATPSNLDEIFAMARIVKDALSIMLTQNVFKDWTLRNDRICIECSDSSAKFKLMQRYPSMNTIYSHELYCFSKDKKFEVFNALREVYYDLLLEASMIDNKDKRLKSLASWGRKQVQKELSDLEDYPIISRSQYEEIMK